MITKQAIRAATGWLELGMPEDALEELSSLPMEDRSERKVLELKLAAEMAIENWKNASVTAVQLCDIAEDEPDYFMSAAYCLHESGNTDEAHKCLLNGPSVLNEFAVYHYNMACYLWTLGKNEAAKQALRQAVEMDESFLEAARSDRDLVGIQL